MKLEEVRHKKTCLLEELKSVEIGREETEERSGLLKELEKRKQDRAKLNKELDRYQSCDPQRLSELRELILVM